MLKHKPELILGVILIPIAAYILWQAYNTYLKPPAMDIEELEKAGTLVEQKAEKPPESKGTLDYAGYIERDPLRPSLPVKEKIVKPSKPARRPDERPAVLPALPAFTVTGIVWGKASPRAIIDGGVYKIGDIVNGAKILDITQKGIYMIYEGKKFWVNVPRGG